MLSLKLFLLVIFLLFSTHRAAHIDDEFAEFEQFDDEEFETVPPVQESVAKPSQAIPKQSERVAETSHLSDVEIEDEDSIFNDEEEFEPHGANPKAEGFKEPTILKEVPLPRRGRLDAYVAELIMLGMIVTYFLNYLAGRSKNIKLAHAWLDAHRELLEKNFHVVGDDGQGEAPSNKTILLKNAEHIYNLWCTGRVCCEGMLVELRFIKRQCLLHQLTQLFKPQTDKIILRVTMEKEAVDTFVLAIGTKKAITSLQKEMTDLASFCNDKKRGELFGLPGQFQVLSEIHEAAETVLDQRMLTIFDKYSEYIDYVHISDQYSGAKLDDQNTYTKLPETETTFVFCLNVPGQSADDIAKLHPLVQYCLYFIDRYARLRLSREAKSKADKNRQKVMERHLKEQHAQRQEEAQKKREEKIRQEKEKILEMDDEKRSAKLEAQQLKKELKKRQKSKIMKVKM